MIRCFDQIPLLVPESGWTPPAEMPRIRGCRRLGIDTETCDPTLRELGPGVRRGGYVAGLSLATEDGRKWYLPVRHQGGGNLDEGMVWRWARQELNAYDGELVGANLIYELDYLAEHGITFPNVKAFRDVQVAEPLLDENRMSFSLESIAQDYLGEGKSEDLLKEAASAYGAKTAKETKGILWRLHSKYVGPYAEDDALLPLQILAKQEIELAKQDLTDLFNLESELIPILLAMRRRGVRVDVNGAEQVRAKLVQERDAALTKVRHLAGPKAELMAPESFAHALSERGLAVPLTAKTHKPSITKDWLELNKTDELVNAIIEGRRGNSIITTFIDGHIYTHAVNGRIHAQFNQLKASREGGDGVDQEGTIARFCVAGDTLLETSRGSFRIDAYKPTGHDTILTHTGNQRRIVNKFYKGVENMFKITLMNGQSVKCTGGHRILTPCGWKHARDLLVGDYVYHGHLQSALQQSGSFQNIGDTLSVGNKTNDRRSRCDDGPSASDGYGNSQKGFRSGEVQSRESFALFTEQGWGSQPHAREVWGATSQLHRGHRRRPWLFDAQSERKVCVCASYSSCRDAWDTEFAGSIGCSSHRRKQEEQRTGQFSDCDQCGAREASRYYASMRIKEITLVGSMEVWDVEIEGDHSYCANGFIHHNSSSSPNLQNIPARDKVLKPLIRGLFLPEEGQQWYCDDWSQIEYRFLTHYANGQGADEARDAYRTNPKTDFHKLCAGFLGVDPNDEYQRNRVKTINFLSVYGGGAAKLAKSFGCSLEEAEGYARTYHTELPFVKETGKRAAKTANLKGFITTILGRRQRFIMWEPPYNLLEQDKELKKTHALHGALPREKAQDVYGHNIVRAFTYAALNRALQGGAADLMKKALRDMNKAGVFRILGAPLVIVHDEFGHSADQSTTHQEALAEAMHIMETAVTLRVPVVADREVGPNWGNVTKMAA